MKTLCRNLNAGIEMHQGKRKEKASLHRLAGVLIKPFDDDVDDVF